MALLQTVQGNGGGYVNSYTKTLTSVTSGSQLHIWLTAGSADTIGSITDDKSNTWVLDETSTGTDRRTWHYRVTSAVVGTTVVTITFGAGQFPDSVIFLREYSAMDTTSPLDQDTSNSSTTNYVNSHDTGTTATTTNANDVIMAAVGSSGGTSPIFTVPSGFGNLATQSGFDLYTYGAIADKTVSATGTQTAVFGSTEYVRSQSMIGAYKIASAPAGNTTNFFQFIN